MSAWVRTSGGERDLTFCRSVVATFLQLYKAPTLRKLIEKKSVWISWSSRSSRWQTQQLGVYILNCRHETERMNWKWCVALKS